MTPNAKEQEGRSAITASKSRTPSLGKYGRDFTAFSLAFSFLTEATPERLSMLQANFFVLAATLDIQGKPATFSQLREMLGERASSIASSYKVFLGATRHYPQALGWLDTEDDPDDMRVRYLVLTDKGREIMSALHTAAYGGIR